jgi:hypothetical protein
MAGHCSQWHLGEQILNPGIDTTSTVWAGLVARWNVQTKHKASTERDEDVTIFCLNEREKNHAFVLIKVAKSTYCYVGFVGSIGNNALRWRCQALLWNEFVLVTSNWFIYGLQICAFGIHTLNQDRQNCNNNHRRRTWRDICCRYKMVNLQLRQRR